MKTQNILKEPISFEIINSKNQIFVFWADTAMKAIDVYNLFNNRNYKQLPILYNVNEDDNLFLKLPYINFEMEVLMINKDGKLFNIVELNESYETYEFQIESAKYVLITPTGLTNLFSIKTNESDFRIRTEQTFIKKDTTEKIKLNSLTTKVIIESVLSEKVGEGLRSKIPSVYVWYYDLLFFVDNTGFPGYSASTDMKVISKKAIEALKEKGLEPMLFDAVYPRIYFNHMNEINCSDTWWGMRNIGKFLK